MPSMCLSGVSANLLIQHTLNPMRYVLRAEASHSIGSGHIMRSSAIAEQLITRGEEVIFVGQIYDLPWVEERIASLGFTGIYNNPKEFISNAKSDVLLLDSYEIDIDDPFIALKNWHSIVAIVDEQTPNYHCSLRIYPGLDSSWVGKSKTPILAGQNYIPFRASLSKKIATTAHGHRKLKIVVVAGGSDAYGLVHEIAKVLAMIPELFEVYLFSNSTSSQRLDSRFHNVEIGPKLDEVSRDADLIFTTSSTSSLEFIARGFCVGVACAVDNQEQYYRSLGQLRVAAQIGLRTPSSGWNLDIEIIRMLVTMADFRESLTKNAIGLIDFHGASRIVDAIRNL